MKDEKIMSECPCGSGESYEVCCAPFHKGEQFPATAEQLMRSRYCAYVVGEIDYIHTTLHPDHRSDHDLAAAKKWSRDSDWLGLEVITTESGGVEDQTGVVEFKANYRDRGGIRQAHEVSRFERVDGHWVYVDGEMPKPETVRNEGGKVGRNDPCPCGSGKKYKKCCGQR